ncbi:MAG: DMT family transporter [Pseudomonadota bacterium]|nr:DMT family transporter [Pseudomonadota bacterium]
MSLAMISMFSGMVGAIAIPWLGLPDARALPWLALSVFFHTGYRWFLARAYTWGDLGQVYPLARGTAPLLVALIGIWVLDETLHPLTLLGIAILSAGIMVMAFRGGRPAVHLGAHAVLFALSTSAFIAAYTVVDGLGGRASASPHIYAAWLLFLDGIAIFLVLLAARVPELATSLKRFWKPAFFGGLMSAAAYWIAIWAMTKAPIALVAAVRESSILFAALISVFILREPLSVWRSVAATLILLGLIVMRLA